MFVFLLQLLKLLSSSSSSATDLVFNLIMKLEPAATPFFYAPKQVTSLKQFELFIHSFISWPLAYQSYPLFFSLTALSCSASLPSTIHLLYPSYCQPFRVPFSTLRAEERLFPGVLYSLLVWIPLIRTTTEFLQNITVFLNFVTIEAQILPRRMGKLCQRCVTQGWFCRFPCGNSTAKNFSRYG